jgi:hypothetical protein
VIKLGEDFYVNPDQVSHIVQDGPHALVWFTSGRYRTMINTDAASVAARLARK